MTLAAMEPLLPSSSTLAADAEAAVHAADRLGRHLHPLTLAAVADLLRTVNCYYSNLIEGHDTHPISIERAMREEYAPESAARNLQLEARAHIEVQLDIERRLARDGELNVCSADFLRWVHGEFYRRLPDAFRVVRDPATGREEPVVPGELRAFAVRVGWHIPPEPAELPVLLDRFATAYDPRRFNTVSGLIALGAAHHRLLWIHPFGDGNGRVTRLMTDAYLRRIGVGGHGLWTASRGLARRRDKYKAALAAADAPRWDDYDGRGARSLSALTEFCRFFIDVCADQIAYMGALLDVDALADRTRRYGEARALGVLPDHLGATDRAARLHPHAARLLEHLVYRGSVDRGDLAELLGLEPRTARRVVRELIDEGFVTAETRRAALRLRIPAHAAPYLFPGLYQVA